MTDFPDLIQHLSSGSNTYLNDSFIRASAPQSDRLVTEIRFGHRPVGWSDAAWNGVWVQVGGKYIWLTVKEAKALSLGVMQAATRMQNGEPG